MTQPISELLKDLLTRESARRRESAVQQLEALNQKYKPGGKWRLLQPGPPWEACEIWFAELRDVGNAVVAELEKTGTLRSLPRPDIEKAKRALSDWIATEREQYVVPGLKSFLEARGAMIDQELTILRAQVAEHLAQLTKELLVRVSAAAASRRAAKG